MDSNGEPVLLIARPIAAFAVLLLGACSGDLGPGSLAGCGGPCLAPASGSCAAPSAWGAPKDSVPWPHQPAGFTTISDEPFNALTENGWITLQRDTLNGSGVTLADDPRAPLSPPSVLQFTYAKRFPAGMTPAVTFYDLVLPVKEAYFGFWWKPSDPWDNNAQSGVNKIAFILTTETGLDGEAAIIMFGTGGPFTVQVLSEFPGDTRRLSPNLNATPVTLGAWHRVEWVIKFSSTDSTHDGASEWWLDGVPQGSYTDLMMPVDPGFKEFQLAPTWGGVVGTKAERDFFCYDHAHTSAP